MKKRIFSIIVYITNLTLLCCPWIPLGVKRYNYFQFITIAWSKNFQQLIIDAEIPTENMLNLIVGTRAELIIVGISVVFSIIYCILMILGKYRKVNFINTGCLLFVLMMHCSWETLANFCNSDLLGAFVPSFLFLCCLVECIFGYIFMEWDRIKEEVRRNKEREKALEREEKERLGFPGKYAKIFYKIVLKNFWKNCKDFVLLFICNVILFAFFVAGFGLKQILSVENTSKGTLVFNGLNQILVNAIIPMVIISVSVIIILLFYYLKCRARGYGLFMTLGMRKGLFYIFIGTELIACLILSLLFGSFCGKLLLSVLLKNSKEIIGVSLMATNISSMPYLQAVAILLLIYLFSLMAARDIFTDFNIGKSTDLRAIAEKIPNRFPNLIFTFAGMSCIYCMFRYSKRYNFENKSLMLVLFLGIFLAVRYGLCNWLLKERKKKGYLKKLMLHNQLLHRSRTSAGYITVLSIVQFCILFYFSFQIFSAIIAEEPEKQFPYDFVCLADESDDEYFEILKEQYEIKIQEFPMVRVSSYDSTEQNESVLHSGNPIQGQHIGISESTYHALKGLRDKTYEKKELGLSKDGKDIYIIYQQDQSIKAQPTAFWAPRKKPLLHIGLPCSGVNIMSLHQIDIGYKNYEVRGEETGSLIGNFKQGARENIIVFSNEYFEEIKELWKTTHIILGEQIKDEAERIENFTIYQGVTKLVLISAGDHDVVNISGKMEEFEKRHFQKEQEAYVLADGIYDKSVSYCYSKTEAVKNISTEKYMKIVINSLVCLIFLFMFFMILLIKMLSEKEMNCHKLSFLTCMGMRKQERIKLIKNELFNYYYLLPTGLAALLAGIFTDIVFKARMYTVTDMKNYLSYYFPAAVTYLLIVTAVMWTVVSMYAYYVEKRSKDFKTL